VLESQARCRRKLGSHRGECAATRIQVDPLQRRIGAVFVSPKPVPPPWPRIL
jgi:hypothetical protein